MEEFADESARKSLAYQRDYLGKLPHNLVKSGNLGEYYQILSDFDFLFAKINHPEFGVQALIDDYELVDDAEIINHPDYDPDKVKALKLIQETLRLSAHILTQYKTQLAGQLLGRLLLFTYISPQQNISQCLVIKKLLEQAKQWKTAPWLRPLTTSLAPPDGRLLRTLTGHSYLVTAVAVTPNGKQVISGSYDSTLKVWNLETGEVIATFTGDSPISCCAVAPDGVTIAAGDGSGRVHFLRLEGLATDVVASSGG